MSKSSILYSFQKSLWTIRKIKWFFFYNIPMWPFQIALSLELQNNKTFYCFLFKSYFLPLLVIGCNWENLLLINHITKFINGTCNSWVGEIESCLMRKALDIYFYYKIFAAWDIIKIMLCIHILIICAVCIEQPCVRNLFFVNMCILY